MSQVQLFQQSQGRWRPKCVLCKQFVSLEESKTDEYGQAVHEECYLLKLHENRCQLHIVRPTYIYHSAPRP